MTYRARAFLEQHGVSLAELERVLGRSKTTWSRFLAGERTPSGDPRGEIEQLLRARGVRPPRDLWQNETTPAGAPAEPHEEVHLMQGQMLTETAHRHFKLFLSPFHPEAILNPATGKDRIDDLHMPVGHVFVEGRLVQALTTAGFVALAGEPGSGKTTLLERAYRRACEIKPIVKVMPANVERRKLRSMHIAAEIIRQLSGEAVPRTANARDALAQEVLKQRYLQGQRVALVIDEAHELPAETVTDLKRFHEMSHGFARLLAIVLVGQSELAARFELERNFRLREVIQRCQLVELWPMRGEVRGYMARRFSWVGRELDDVFEPDAVAEMERRLAVHDQQLPIIIGNLATAAMNIATGRGNPKVTVDDVESAWTATTEQLQGMGL